MNTTWSRRGLLKAVGLTGAAGAALAACAPAEPEGSGDGGGSSGGTFHGAWPYLPPP